MYAIWGDRGFLLVRSDISRASFCGRFKASECGFANYANGERLGISFGRGIAFDWPGGIGAFDGAQFAPGWWGDAESIYGSKS